MSNSDTWQMMVTVVRRAIRVTQPPMTTRKPTGERANSPALRAHLEDHYALLLAAGY